MLELELTKVPATLESLNLRTEKVGNEKMPAADLKIGCPQTADVLAYFSPTLREFLFEAERDLAGEVLRLRDPHLDYPLGRDEEMSGATVRIGFGIGAPITLTECRINAFKLTPLEGGAVVLAFRVQGRPSPEQVAKLYTILEAAIELTIEPAELVEIKAAR